MAPRKSRLNKKKLRLPNATKSTDIKQNKVIKSLSTKVKKLQKEPELKCWIFFDNFAYGTSVSTTFNQTNPFKLLLNGMTRGTTSYQRVGDIVRNTSVRVNGTIYPTTAPGIGIDAMFRIIIVRYKNPQGRDLQITGNLMSATNGPPLFFNMPGNACWPQQTYNNGIDGQSDAMTQYQIIYDKRYRMVNYVGTTITGPTNACVNPSINFDIKRKLNFNSDLSLSNGGTYGDFNKNSLFLIMITETNTQCTIKLNSHLYFKDS